MVRSQAAKSKGQLQQPPVSRSGPIDMLHLARQTLGDKNLELEVLRMFDEAAAVYFGRIERSTTTDELLRNLHTLKGAAAGIGAKAIAGLAAAAEGDIREGAHVVPERIEDLAIAVAECRAWIEALLAAEPHSS
jgi:HPt (histidine-containing phosphotransfer) domain-containing protein